MRSYLIEQGCDRHTAVCGVAAGRRPQSCDAAERRRDTNGPLGILGDSEGCHAGRDRRCGAATAAAGDTAGIVRVVDSAEGLVVASPAIGELVQVRLTEHDRTDRSQRSHDWRVLGRSEVAQSRRARGRGVVACVDAVLYRNRQAE